MGDYHDLYVRLDTLLLADCFENFRKVCMKEYKLDPCYFVSAPGLAFEAFLKHTDVELELLTDNDMILMCEKGIRGGITQAIHRYLSGNKKYMNNFREDMASSFLMYLDANNLYDWTMCRKLPLNNFEWIGNPNEMFTTKSILNYDEETNEKGCLLEVDIEYPKELHNAHSKLPFCPLKDKKTSTNTRYSKAIQKARKKK